jgi:PIN domain nuclease of toxin-antitoxin system
MIPAQQWLADILLLNELRFEPVSAEIAEVAGSFDDAFPGDPADRIIAATAVTLGVKLVTADTRLRRAPHLHAVW